MTKTKLAPSKRPHQAQTTKRASIWLGIAEDVVKEVYKEVKSKGLEKRALEEAVKGFSVDDLSTQLDERVTKLFLDYFKKRGIPIMFFSEESGLTVIGKNPKVTAFVDELDGTAMAFHNIEGGYSTTIAILNNTKDFNTNNLLACATVRYTDGTVYSAGRGIGSFVNGIGSRTSTRTDLDDPKALMIFCGTSETLESLNEYDERFFKLKCFKRDLGTAALHFAYVSSGQVDAYIHKQQKLNDLGAGTLLVREGGGRVTDLDGNDFNGELSLKGTTKIIAAANEHILKQLLPLVRRGG